MKKNFFKQKNIFLLVCCLFLFSACSSSNEGFKKNDSLSQEDKTLKVEKKEKMNDFLSMEQFLLAVEKGDNLSCKYVIDEGGVKLEVDTFVSGEKYKTVSTRGDMQLFAVYDGETFYSWGSKDKKGTKMDKECLQSFGEVEAEEDGDKAEVNKDFKNSKQLFDEGFNAKCVLVDEGFDFSVPEDVSFIDQCELMNSLMNQTPLDVDGSVNFEIPDEIKNMME